MSLAHASRSSQLGALLVYTPSASPHLATTQVGAMVVYAPPSTKINRTSQLGALTPYEIGIYVVPQTSQLGALIVYGTGIPNQSRSRAWTFTLDGHTFYVLNLGSQGTWLYDVITKQWCQFETDGYDQWNMINGTMWGNSQIVAGDSITDQVWSLDPSAVLDEAWRQIEHVVTGGLQTRNRVYHSVEALRLNASFGLLDDVNGAAITLNYSDDQGTTWSPDLDISLTEGDYTGEIAWRSLGAFSAPGRIFRISDIGGLIRINGADVYVDGFDESGNDTSGGG